MLECYVAGHCLRLTSPTSLLPLSNPFLLQSAHLFHPSPPPSCTKPTWNANSRLIINHPVLQIMESCNSMSQLMQIHAHMIRTGLIFHRFPASRVLAFCALSDNGDMSYARLVFSQISDRNVYIWNTMIRGFSRENSPELGFALFCEMVREQAELDDRTFVFALKICEKFSRPLQGEGVHSTVLKLGFGLELLLQNGLMHFYVKFDLLGSARLLFDESIERDVVTWTTMIDGYSQKDIPDEALKLFYMMLSGGVEPNEVTMITVLSACSQIGILTLGNRICQYMDEKSVNLSVNLVNALVDMYAKCGGLDIAREIFDRMEIKDVFSWTTMVNGYAKSGDLPTARQLFDLMPERNVVSWNAMIAGYSQMNHPKEALDMFHEMKRLGMQPSEDTLVSVLSACAQLGCLDLGTEIYSHYVVQNRVLFTVPMRNAYIDMYGRCGNIEKAYKLFCNMPKRDLVSWNSMIAVYAAHGYGKEALLLFDQMIDEGMIPDDITFVGLLSACSHAGLVLEGHNYFKNMARIYNIQPKVKHYACMIDLLGRVGLLQEAYELIKTMPTELDKASWGALLNGCKMHGHTELGKLAGNKLMELDPHDSGTYVLLSNIYATGNRWDGVKMVRNMMRLCGVKKTPGYSSIEVDGRFHEFLVADRSHPRHREIYLLLDNVYIELDLEGYVPKLVHASLFR